MPTSAERLQQLPPYVFSTIGDRIRTLQQAGHDVIRLDIGSPDMPPPPLVIEKLHESAQNPQHHSYSGYRGTAAFRKAIARYYARRFGVDLDPDTEVLPLIGSKEGIVNLTLAYADRGDVVIIPDMSYPSYAQGARLAGADIHWVPMRAETGFLPDLDAIPPEVLRKAKLLWLNYPNNPTGAVADQNFYERAVRFCAEQDILLASDNPYESVTFDGYQAGSPLQIEGARDHVVEFVSFSKTYNMAGWRLGAAVGQPEAIQNLLSVKSNIDSGHFVPAYDAGIAAVDHITKAWIDERNAIYARRRDIILDALPDLGLSAVTPQATLYVWAKVDEQAGDGLNYSERAREETFVSLAPGVAYGPGGDPYVRISLSVPDERLKEGLQRLRQWARTQAPTRP